MSDAAIQEKALGNADAMKGGEPAAPQDLAIAAASANAGMEAAREKAAAGAAPKTLPRNPDVAWKSQGFVEVADQF